MYAHIYIYIEREKEPHHIKLFLIYIYMYTWFRYIRICYTYITCNDDVIRSGSSASGTSSPRSAPRLS